MKHANPKFNMVQDPSGRIPDDEPVFLLRGRDLLAPQLVIEWAERFQELGGDPSRAKIARDHAFKMYKWQEEHERKYPDGTVLSAITEKDCGDEQFTRVE